MSKKGPIVLVEDDHDDQEIIKEVLKELGILNRLSVFSRCEDAFHFLKSTPEQPFLIICDINLPELNGLEFKKELDADPQLRRRSIPFIFFSTTGNRKTVTEAYTKMTVQGFFQKSNSYDELKDTLKTILDYWKLCLHPNNE